MRVRRCGSNQYTGHTPLGNLRRHPVPGAQLLRDHALVFCLPEPRDFVAGCLLKTLVSNCTFDRGSLLATYKKPFDMLVEGNGNGNWLGGRDSNPDNGVQSAVSYR
jgi:hypothetical protein